MPWISSHPDTDLHSSCHQTQSLALDIVIGSHLVSQKRLAMECTVFFLTQLWFSGPWSQRAQHLVCSSALHPKFIFWWECICLILVGGQHIFFPDQLVLYPLKKAVLKPLLQALKMPSGAPWAHHIMPQPFSLGPYLGCQLNQLTVSAVPTCPFKKKAINVNPTNVSRRRASNIFFHHLGHFIL